MSGGAPVSRETKIEMDDELIEHMIGLEES